MERREQRETQRQRQPQPMPSPCEHLPQDVRQVWQQVWNDERCKNLSLLLDRYAPWRRDARGNRGNWELRMRYLSRQKTEEATGQGAKGLWLKDDDQNLLDAPVKPNLRLDEKLMAAFKERWHYLLEWHRQQGCKVRKFEAQPVWCFVVGLGASHVLETSITLHRILGLPIIPGSALKGVARAYALFELAQQLGVPILSPAEVAKKAANKEITPLAEFEALLLSLEDEERWAKLHAQLLRNRDLPEGAQIRSLSLDALQEKCRPFVEVFGTTEKAGGVIFLDAIPLETPKFQLDIMNPHYPQYYDHRGGKQEEPKPPADWESPRPVFFLTVSETPYLFAIAARTEQANDLLDVAERWLKGALNELGVGAKTSADYGYWEVTEP